MTKETEAWALKYLLRFSAQLWKWYKPRKDKKYAVAQKTGWLVCEKCGFKRRLKTKGAKDLFEVDHLEPVGQRPYLLKDYEWYLRRRLCEPSNMMLLCKKKCHALKTKIENEARYEARRKLKEAK